MGFTSGMSGLEIAQGVSALGSTWFNWQNERENAKRQAAALSKQAGAAVKRMNYAFQNYELQRTDAFDAAVNNIMKVRQNSLNLLSGVRAAVNEETGGDSRTGRALERTANADMLRTISSVKDNYERQSDEIDLNKESVMKSTQDEIESIRAQAPELPSTTSLLLGMAGTGLSWYNDYLNNKTAREAALGIGYTSGNYDWNHWRQRYRFADYPKYNEQFLGTWPGLYDWNTWKGGVRTTYGSNTNI